MLTPKEIYAETWSDCASADSVDQAWKWFSQALADEGWVIVQAAPAPGAPLKCPDGGACHHDCSTSCFRVEHCGPLSGVFPNDEWPTK